MVNALFLVQVFHPIAKPWLKECGGVVALSLVLRLVPKLGLKVLRAQGQQPRACSLGLGLRA